jgi:hypothetical protein
VPISSLTVEMAKHNYSHMIVSSAVSLTSCGATLPSQDNVQQICISALHHTPGTYIIIDALDECNEISQSVSWLKELLTGGDKLHVLITSRDKPDITVHANSKLPQQQVIHLNKTRRTAAFQWTSVYESTYCVSCCTA